MGFATHSLGTTSLSDFKLSMSCAILFFLPRKEDGDDVSTVKVGVKVFITHSYKNYNKLQRVAMFVWNSWVHACCVLTEKPEHRMAVPRENVLQATRHKG